jgi:peptidoglycan LD-endopeptidase CwlK
MNEIVDSGVTKEEALADSESLQAPTDIKKELVVLDVTYFGFDQKTHLGQIVMHQATILDVQSFFSLALALEFPFTSVIPISDKRFSWDDSVSCLKNNTSGYNFRYITGDTVRLSNHARGTAFDVNPKQNIYISYDAQGKELQRIPPHGTYDETVEGTLNANHPLVIHMKALGWIWGGDWDNPKDYQHFEKPL